MVPVPVPAPVPVLASVAKQTELPKDNSNTYFKKGRLLAAIEAYTEAHDTLGLAFLEREDCVGGIKELEKAFDLEGRAKCPGHLVDDVWQILSKAKYKEWERQSSERSWKLQKLKDICEKALLEHHLLNVSEDKDEVKGARSEHSKQLEHLK